MKNGITCPECNGNGFSEGYVCPGFKLIKIKCSFCGESGQVTVVDMLRRENGKKMRDDRMARGVSLREEAKKLGLKPSELGDKERGILRRP